MNKAYVYILQAMQVAYDIFSTLLIGVVLGLLADRYLGIQPIGILVGSVLGIIGSFKNILKIGKE